MKEGKTMRFRDKLIRLFSGRYGIDELSRFLFLVYLVAAVILTVAEFFYAGWILFAIHILLTALAAYVIFRTMSRSIYQRQAENRTFLGMRDRFVGWFRLQKSKCRDRKTHVYRKCPYCKSVLRLKKIKGDHRAACPRCTKSFDITIR